jgi:hypothetical protein
MREFREVSAVAPPAMNSAYSTYEFGRRLRKHTRDLSVALLHQILFTPRAQAIAQVRLNPTLKDDNPGITKSLSNPWKISFLFILFSPRVIFRVNLRKLPGESADIRIALIVVYIISLISGKMH